MTGSALNAKNDETAALRRSLVDQLKSRGLATTPQIEGAFLAVPRHLFVPGTDIEAAYNDTFVVTKKQDEVPISSCSQPSITALMLDMLGLQPGQRVLEIGAGTGYAAALMAHIVGDSGQVFTVDLDEDIVEGAREHLASAGVSNVQVICADGGLGWSEDGPYDRIILTVGAARFSPAFIEQLRPGGRMVIPFDLTPFRSELTPFPDEILLALERTDNSLQSVLIRPSFFMGLRGAMAVTPVQPLSLNDTSTLSCVTTQTVQSEAAREAFVRPFQDEATEVYTSSQELGGLRLWLALRDPRFCELYIKGEQLEKEAFPRLFRPSDTFAATMGFYQNGSWALLQFSEEDLPPEPKRPLRLGVRLFGEKRELAQRLKEEIALWADAQRPLVWGPMWTLENLYIYVSPPGVPHPSEAHAILTLDRGVRMIFTTQAQTTTTRTMPEERDPKKPLNRQEQIALLLQGKEHWNNWRKSNPTVSPDLVAADLQGAILKELDLRLARLNGANLTRADLFGSDLSGAELNGADLREVRAANANLNGADLRGSDVSGAFFVKAHLCGSLLNGSDLSGARFKNSVLHRADLRGAQLGHTHLNQTSLQDADLRGAQLNTSILQDIFLPNVAEPGERLSSFRQKAAHLLPHVQGEEVDHKAHKERFSVKDSPHLVLKNTHGELSIRAWNEPYIQVAAQSSLPQMHQEQDTLFIDGSEQGFSVLVPYIPHGIVKVVQHGSSTITTAITCEYHHGDIIIEDAGTVSLDHVNGAVTLNAIVGDVYLSDIEGGVNLSQVTGNVEVKNTSQAVIDVVGGSVFAEHIQQALHCGAIGGNCRIQESKDAEIIVEQVEGNAQLQGVARSLECRIGGNADVQLQYPPRSIARIRVGGTITISLPEDADLRVSIGAGNAINDETHPGPKEGSFATFVYREGAAILDVIAGGNVYLR